MANNKMLIDASHPEETRVVVVRGNRIEEFDFEAQERRQLRGNIYLAKVTRVEPSLQAAFIDYGGNRHGFLAFSEIHPDYYQIPAADRQALIEAQAEAAAREVEEEEAEVIEVAEENSDDIEDDDNVSDEAQPKKRSRRKPRRGNRSRKAKGENGDSETDAEASEASLEDDADEASESFEDSDDQDEDSTSGRSMAAMMDIDSISEAAPESEDEGGDEASTSEGEGEPKKKAKRPARRKAAPKKKTDSEKPEDVAETIAATTETEADEALTQAGEEAAAPKKTRRKAKPRKSAKKTDKSSDADENNESAEVVETVSDLVVSDEAVLNDDFDDTEIIGDIEETTESIVKVDAAEGAPSRRPRRQYKIQEVIRRRQVMLVQVVKEERGNKGAALTTYLSLAGRYSVLMPNTARGGGISRKITNPADRKRLKEIAQSLEVPKGMGVILRTAGASLEKEEINRDFDYLMRLWENVRNLTLASSAPFLVYEEGSLIKRSIRDLYNKDIGEIIVSGEDGFKEAKNFMQMMMPDHVKNVKFYDGEQPLLSKFNIESQLDKMVTPQVTLKSGGYLVINQTEALVAIDVNSGRSTREHSIEATALQTNLEAAEEVARQLRLRDLAGLVVIDFIDMEEKRNNRAVERKLKDCLKNDRARIQVGHISHFGLMEMSRQRIRASVLESTMAVCPVCQGVGHVRSDSSFALHVLRAIDDHLTRHPRFDVTVKVAPSTAMYIFNQKRQAVSELEDRYGVRIAFESDPHLQVQDFSVEKGASSTREVFANKAVNPMEFEDENVEQETPVEAVSSATSESDEESRNNLRRNKRRRGRGRGRGRDRDENPESNSGETSSQDADNADNDANYGVQSDDQPEIVEISENESVAEAPERESTPRRGPKARGRSNSGIAAKAEGAVQPAKKVADEIADEAKEPRRRTGRPGKKPVVSDAPLIKKSEADAQPAASSGPAGAPPRELVRRNTKRVRKTKADDESKGDAGEISPASDFNNGFLK